MAVYLAKHEKKKGGGSKSTPTKPEKPKTVAKKPETDK